MLLMSPSALFRSYIAPPTLQCKVIASPRFVKCFICDSCDHAVGSSPGPSRYNESSSVITFCGLRAPPVTAHGQWMPQHIKSQLQKQIAQLEHELAHELPAEIKKAVAMGDLSENAEYHMAKQRQEFVNARLGQLKRRMAELSLVNLANIPRDKAGFGSTVVVYDSTKDEEIEYRLVTSEESDVAKGLISTTSPIGRGLVGKRVGDMATVVTPNGKREMEILKLTTIHDEAGGDDEEDGEGDQQQ